MGRRNDIEKRFTRPFTNLYEMVEGDRLARLAEEALQRLGVEKVELVLSYHDREMTIDEAGKTAEMIVIVEEIIPSTPAGKRRTKIISEN